MVWLQDCFLSTSTKCKAQKRQWPACYVWMCTERLHTETTVRFRGKAWKGSTLILRNLLQCNVYMSSISYTQPTIILTVVYVSDIWLSSLYWHVEFVLVCMCMVLLPCVFHVWLTLRMLSVVVGPRACCSSNVSCVIVIELLLRWSVVVHGVCVPAEGPTTLH